MYKIRKVEFLNHPVLGNLCLDFCDCNNKAVDTVIFAGINGVGKSCILNELYNISSHAVKFDLDIEFELGCKLLKISYRLNTQDNLMYISSENWRRFISDPQVHKKYHFSGIFSDVDINFNIRNIDTVTSLSLDSQIGSRKSSADLPTQIKQLLIDIQSLDDSEVANYGRANPNKSFNDIYNSGINLRMPRFTKAFYKIFDELKYKRIATINGHKTVLFQKSGKDISIDDLSSGEKQIVYRGCFLLKDINALNGAFVFIDEPEISLHPTWQERIMEYYKGIFTNAAGEQTSQIFVVTHSPFIIHNENRKNDKVIVLSRDQDGKIILSDKAEYYKCNSIEVIRDAFSFNGFVAEKSTVYLEGRTDEKYFNKALKVYKYEDVPFQFRWIGYIEEKNGKQEERNTGKDSLNKAAEFLIARNLPIKNICLFDCDTKKVETYKNNLYIRVMPPYDNSNKERNITAGIENALVLDKINLSDFYRIRKETKEQYAEEVTIEEFDKMKLCDHICNMDEHILLEEKVFIHLKQKIDELIAIF